VVHTPLRLDQATGSLFFPGGGLCEGQRVQLMQRDPEKIQQSAHDCAARLAAQHPGQDPDLVLQFDCAGRGQSLFGSAVRRRVVDPLQAPFAATVPWLGLHTYGEIAPLADRTHYHNYTVALCALFGGRA
jgi:small ligand-binding sensory domain FIST